MNHRNAIPANGTILSAIKILERIPGFVSHSPGSFGSVGIESLMIIKLAMSSNEKIIPAKAEAHGPETFSWLDQSLEPEPLHSPGDPAISILYLLSEYPASSAAGCAF